MKSLKSLGIEPNAIEQWIDFSIPENLYMLAIYLAAPQVENDRLSARTKVGMRQASKEGKWQGSPPYGYVHNKAAKKEEKALIIRDDRASHVKEAFALMATGFHTAESCRRRMKERGMKLSKQAFLDMLKNVAYTGKIKIPAFFG
ncbi:MAG: hypothetical protein EOO88_08575 [Pedobacter sp.]|nr:MAG: hypothetical protein EOO88_08575 [Pedobacter sp.]